MSYRIHTVSLLTIALLVAAGCEDDSAGMQASGFTGDGGRLAAGPVGFDVSENMDRFSFDEAPVFDDGTPAYGNAFVTQGYIYPLGFLDTHEGTNEDGSPTHPNKVIGLWTCRGHFIGKGAQTKTGPWVITTQLYDFFESPGYAADKASGHHNLVSEGYEIADFDKPIRRSITGGTGLAKQSGSEIEQVLLGFNASEGVNLRLSTNPPMRASAEGTERFRVDPIDGLRADFE